MFFVAVHTAVLAQDRLSRRSTTGICNLRLGMGFLPSQRCCQCNHLARMAANEALKMNRGLYALLAILLLCTVDSVLTNGAPHNAPTAHPAQTTKVDSQKSSIDPLKGLEASFPDTIRVKNKGRLLEFCPDGTCDGFVVGGTMSVATLKDFAYLYVYFFSDYTFLDEWRSKKEAKETADRVLSKPEYHNCRNEIEREAARCVLQELTSKGKVELIFVRYDEGERHVVHRKISEQLTK